MLVRAIVVIAFISAAFNCRFAMAQTVELDAVVDQAGSQIGVPRSLKGTSAASGTSVGWKSEDGRLELLTLQFPATRTLDDIHSKIRSQKGRQITKDEMSATHFALEGINADGTQFIVHVETLETDKRGFSISYRAAGRPEVATLARQIAESYSATGNGAAAPANPPQQVQVPITNVDGPTPKSEAELTQVQKQAIQAQLAALSHKWPDRDGEFREGTRAAIKSYQRTYRGPETGILTAADINSLMQSGVYIAEIIRLEGRDHFTTVDYDPLGKEKCDAIRADLDAMVKAALVSIDKTEAQAGGDIGLSWTFTPQQRRHPMYLMITFDQPVRFAGKGYYVLMPGARTAFGLTHANDRTRVVVPLYVTGGAASRAIRVTPVLAGSLAIDAAIVAPTGCGEQVASIVARTTVTVTPGKPEIEIAEDVPLDAVQQTILSPAGDRRIEVTGDNTFRLLASKNGRVIRLLPGKDPRFSPTGRFLTAINEDGYVIRDALDGERLSNLGGVFSWDNKDSFILSGTAGSAGIDIRFPAVAGESGGGFALGCRVCDGLGDATVKIDLENNLVLGAMRDAPTTRGAFSLSEPLDASDRIAPNDMMPKYGSEAQFAEAISRVLPLVFPTDWEFIEKAQFPYLSPNPEGVNTTSPWRRFYSRGMEPVLQQAAAAMPHSAAPSERGLSRSLSREVSALSPAFDPKRRSFAARLADFGIKEQLAIPFEPISDPLKPTSIKRQDFAGNSYTIKAFKLAPQLQVDADSNECDYEDAKPDRRNVLTLNVQRTVFYRAKLDDHALWLMGGGCMSGSMGYYDYVFGLFDSRRPTLRRPIASSVAYEAMPNPGDGCEREKCDYHAVLSHERYILIWSSFSAAIEVVDLQQNKTMAFSPFRGNAVEQLSLTPDARMLVQRNRDGTFALHDVSKGVPVKHEPHDNGSRMGVDAQTAVLYGRYADDEIIVWTPSGYFDATYEGAAQVHLRFAGLSDLYTFDQFATIMRRQGLAGLVMQGSFKDEPIVYKIPPTISGTIRAQGDDLSLALQQTSGKRLNHIVVYQDGLRGGDLIPEVEGRELKMTVKRLPGVRWAAAVGIDEDGLISQPVIVDLGPAPNTRTLRMLGIGVDKYVSDRLPRLNFAGSDINRIIRAAKSPKSQIYSAVDPVALLGDKATRHLVIETLKDIVRKSSEADDIMLVFAGHGLQGSDGRYYLALAQTDTSDLQNSAVGWDEISTILAGAKSRVLVVLDSCHSGDASQGMFSTNDDLAAELLSRSGNLVVLSGSKGRESSIEDAGAGGGHFSAAIAEAITNPASPMDRNNNRVLEASELYAFVKRSVLSGTGGRQTPWIARNKMIGDFSVF